MVICINYISTNLFLASSNPQNTSHTPLIFLIIFPFCLLLLKWCRLNNITLRIKLHLNIRYQRKSFQSYIPLKVSSNITTMKNIAHNSPFHQTFLSELQKETVVIFLIFLASASMAVLEVSAV